LRERREEIPLLAQYFLRRYAQQNNCVVPELSGAVLEGLKSHDWPGNVRELENTLERLIVLSDGGPVTPELLRFTRQRYVLRNAKGTSGSLATDVPSLIRALVPAGVNAPRPDGIDLHPFLVDGVERALIEEVMRDCGGTQVTAAKRLGLNRNTPHKKMEHEQAEGQTRAS